MRRKRELFNQYHGSYRTIYDQRASTFPLAKRCWAMLQLWPTNRNRDLYSVMAELVTIPLSPSQKTMPLLITIIA